MRDFFLEDLDDPGDQLHGGPVGKGGVDVARAVGAGGADLDGDVRKRSDRDAGCVGDGLDLLEGGPDRGPGGVVGVGRVHVAIDDEPAVIGLEVEVDVEAADVEVLGQRVRVHGVPGIDDLGDFVEGVHLVAVPEAKRVGERDRLVGEGGDDAEVDVARAAEGEVEVWV